MARPENADARPAAAHGTPACGPGAAARRRGDRSRPRRRPAGPRGRFVLWWVGGAAYAAFLALRVLRWTTRRMLSEAFDVLERLHRDERVIIAFWHDRLIGMALAFSTGRICVLTSWHRDGDLITRCVRRLGITAVRGSSTRGWAGGLRGLLEAHRAGSSIVIAADGPRGPRHRAKPGALQLARATGAEVVPVTFFASRCWRAGSWDRLAIPWPFARIAYVQGRGVRVARDASPAEVEAARAVLEAELERIAHVARTQV
jgi:lysophospholipid acyltransferase (LPLAT)-like uncharacterized protein